MCLHGSGVPCGVPCPACTLGPRCSLPFLCWLPAHITSCPALLPMVGRCPPHATGMWPPCCTVARTRAWPRSWAFTRLVGGDVIQGHDFSHACCEGVPGSVGDRPPNGINLRTALCAAPAPGLIPCPAPTLIPCPAPTGVSPVQRRPRRAQRPCLGRQGRGDGPVDHGERVLRP